MFKLAVTDARRSVQMAEVTTVGRDVLKFNDLQEGQRVEISLANGSSVTGTIGGSEINCSHEVVRGFVPDGSLGPDGERIQTDNFNLRFNVLTQHNLRVVSEGMSLVGFPYARIVEAPPVAHG
jgi:hypothetical protein